MLELTRNTAASLATEGHIFCAGTLAQCLHRWNKLPVETKASAFLKMGRDGVQPVILRGEQIVELAGNPDLLRS